VRSSGGCLRQRLQFRLCHARQRRRERPGGDAFAVYRAAADRADAALATLASAA